MIEVSIRGAAELRRVAALLRAEHKTRQRNINASVRQTTRPLERAIRAELPQHVPNRYAGVLGAALKISTTFRATGVHMLIRAMSRKEERDVRAVNAGLLAHPIFGNRKNWVKPPQRVRPGFVDDPVAAMADDVYRSLEKVAEEIRQRVERG